MKDFIIVVYIVSLAMTLPITLLCLFIFKGKRTAFLLHFSEFMLGMFCNILLNTVIYYSARMGSPFEASGLFRCVNYLSLAMFIHSIPFLVSSLLRLKLPVLLKLVFHLHIPVIGALYIANGFWLLFPFRRLFIVLTAYLLALMAGAAILILLRNGRIKNDLRRKAAVFHAFLFVLFAPGFILQIITPPSAFSHVSGFAGFLSLASVPAFYILLNSGVFVCYLASRQVRGSVSDMPAEPAGDLALSRREMDVAALLVKGLSYREICGKLFVSMSTVKTHINRIYKKTGARSKIELYNVWLGKGKPVP